MGGSQTVLLDAAEKVAPPKMDLSHSCYSIFKSQTFLPLIEDTPTSQHTEKHTYVIHQRAILNLKLLREYSRIPRLKQTVSMQEPVSPI